MSDRFKVLPDLLPNIGFNLDAQEQFIQDHSVVLEHWAAIPSPIGLKDRGEYRRSDAIDNIATGAFIYEKVGEFTGTILGNSKKYKTDDGGIFDDSMGRLVLPKYYNSTCDSKQKVEIQLLPGDKIYAKDIEIRVATWQRAEYNPKGIDILQFPAKCVSILRDSNNVEYKQGRHFKIDKDGNIKWISGRKSPGVDPETGKGRVYSVRYTYLAHWYVIELINEIRITNEGSSNTPTRMPYHAVIQREHVYRDKNRADQTQVLQPTEQVDRTTPEPDEKLDPNEYEVKVEIKDFE